MEYIISILILGAIVLFHEYGHFLAATKSGVTVTEFAIGWGPRIGKIKKGTTFSLRAIPLGGFCAMDEDEFLNSPLWKRAVIIAAGPLFNILLAFLCCTVLVAANGASFVTIAGIEKGFPAWEAGLRTGDKVLSYNGHRADSISEVALNNTIYEEKTDRVDIKYERRNAIYEVSYVPNIETKYMIGITYEDGQTGEGVTIDSVSKGSPAQKAGIKIGDTITNVDQKKIKNADDLSNIEFGNKQTVITILRNGKKSTFTILPQKTVYPIKDFSFGQIQEKQSVIGILRYGFRDTAAWIRITGKSILGLFKGSFQVSDMTGPIGIVKSVGESVGSAAKTSISTGFFMILEMAAMLSVNIGIFNLLPLPALDGGKLVQMLGEAIRKKKVNEKIEEWINVCGFACLCVFAVLVTIQDIANII